VDRRRYENVPVIDRRSEGLPDDAVVFGAFNNSYKITQPMVDLWMRILHQVPDSVLWLVDDNPEATRRLKLHAAGQGIDPARLVFSGRAATERYQARLRLVDLFLDCFPYNAGSTACDVVHMGTPLLTLSGRTFVSRMAGSLLHHLGVPELIVQDQHAYVDAAVALGRDRPRLAQLRERLGRAVQAGEGAAGFTRELERVMVQAHEGVEPPAQAVDLDEWPRVPAAAPVATQVPAPIGPGRVHPYQIAYSQETFEAVGPGWLPLDYRTNDRPDWQEYWPIRRYLLNETLREGEYYGFFSPRFTEKTGLDARHLTQYMAQLGDDVDVVLFSPQPDMGAFFLNVFEQNELFDPGFTQSAQALCAMAGLSVDLGQLVMDSRHIVFSNYFMARPAFWRRWLSLCEVLFDACENRPQQAREAGFLTRTSYRDGIERKVFLLERLASLLLVAESAWKVHAFDTFKCAYSASRLNNFRDESVVSDALKIAMSVQKYDEYTAQFANIRNKLRS